MEGLSAGKAAKLINPNIYALVHIFQTTHEANWSLWWAYSGPRALSLTSLHSTVHTCAQPGFPGQHRLSCFPLASLCSDGYPFCALHKHSSSSLNLPLFPKNIYFKLVRCVATQETNAVKRCGCETRSKNQFIKELKTLHAVKHEKPSTDEINVSVTTGINTDVSAAKQKIWGHQQFTRLLIFNSSFSEASLTPVESKFCWNRASLQPLLHTLAVRPELPF